MRLIDADALKKDWSMANKCEECPQDARKCQYEQDFSRMDICEMLDEAPTVGGWISVKDRLPDKDVFVLTYGDGIMEVMKLSDATVAGVTLELWKTNDDYFIKTEDVTHWMPLPSTEGLNET